MGFCTKCGRPRTGTSRFCTGCGADLGDADLGDAADATPQAADTTVEPDQAARWAAEPAPAPPTVAGPAPIAEAAPAEQPAATEPGPGATRADFWTGLPDLAEAQGADLTRWDTHWYRQDPAPAAQEPQAAPAGPSGYDPQSYGQETLGPGSYGQPPSHGPASYGPASYGQAPPGPVSYGQAPYQSPPHVPGTISTPPLGRNQSAILITLVIVALLAVGGGAFFLVSRLTGHSSHASGSPGSSAPAHTPSSGGATAPTSPAGSTSAASPSAKPTVSPTGSAGGGTVALSPSAAANPAAAKVRTYLERYFAAINNHDYQAYSSLLDAQLRAKNSQASFDSGYATTQDSAEALDSISDISGGGEAATVSFTSRQSPSSSIDNSPCNNWTITLYLQPHGSSYLDSVPPSSYQPTYTDCA